jgi:signal transduction histidine kinase
LNERGELVDVFALGGPPGPIADLSLTSSRSSARSGMDVAFPLVRAGRTIGRLRIAGQQELLSSQLDALRAAADLIAVATYNVEMYEREQANVRRLQEVDRLKDAFLGTISHELRTPITAIGGFVTLLTERWNDISDEQRRDFFDRLGRNATSLGLLVDELLDFARLERQALSVSAVPMDLTGKVERTVAQLVPLLGEHQVTTDLEPGATAMADPGGIERILANLLTNAAKYSPPASRIDVSVRKSGGYVELTVADEGAGIAPEDRSRIFSTFYRGDSEATRSTRGAGIGLAVVRELVQQMGGTIDVRDNVPCGTRMVVRLPAAAAPTAKSAPRPRKPARAETERLARSDT